MNRYTEVCCYNSQQKIGVVGLNRCQCNEIGEKNTTTKIQSALFKLSIDATIDTCLI